MEIQALTTDRFSPLFYSRLTVSKNSGIRNYEKWMKTKCGIWNGSISQYRILYELRLHTWVFLVSYKLSIRLPQIIISSRRLCILPIFKRYPINKNFEKKKNNCVPMTRGKP